MKTSAKYDEARTLLNTLATTVSKYKTKTMLDSDWDNNSWEYHTPKVGLSSSYGTMVDYPGTSVRNRSKSPKPKFIANMLAGSTIATKYKEARLAFIREDYTEDMATWNVNRFINEVLKEERLIDEIVKISAEEAAEVETTWDLDLYLLGLVIDSESYNTDKLVFRKPSDEDFQHRIVYTFNADQKLIATPFRSRLEPVQTIVSWNSSGIPRGLRFGDVLVNEIEKVLHQIRLAFGGRFITTAWKAEADWITEPSHLDEYISPTKPILRRLSHYQVSHLPEITIDQNNVDFYKILESRVFGLDLANKETERRISRATRMYNIALGRQPNETLLFSIFGLENLFSDGGAEITLKLTQRVSMMLSFFNYDIMSVYRDVKTAYSGRSDIVHGRELKIENTPELSLLSNNLLEYLRKCILIWHQLPKGNDYGKIVKLLDTVAFDSKSVEKFVHTFKDITI